MSAAAVVAWLGVLDASGADRAARRWFAIGLTFTAVGDLIYNYYEITGHTPISTLSDTLFLLLGPCFLLGLVAVLREHRGAAAAHLPARRVRARPRAADAHTGSVLAAA